MKPELSAFIAFPAQSCTLVSHHRPHRKILRFGDGGFGRIRWIFPNRGRQDCLQKQGCRTHLTCCVDSTRKSGRLPQEPHPPRRAHDTLQPQDESIIVGYYTSAGSAPRPAGRTNVKGALWRETTGLTVSSPCGLCSGCGEADPLVQEVQRQITCGNCQGNDYAGEQQ